MAEARTIDMEEIKGLDDQIGVLFECKPLPEN